MSHYPSSDELASLRWAFHEDMPDHAPERCPIDEPRRESGWPTGGAWPHERAHGIGHRSFVATFPYWSGMRQWASAMRSRAYHRMARDCDARWMLPVLDLLNPDGSYFGPWFEETHFGVPYTFHPSYLPA